MLVLDGLALTELVWTPTSTFPVLIPTVLVLVLLLPPLPFLFTFLVLVCAGLELVLVFLTTLVVPPLFKLTLPGGVVTAGGGGALPLLGDG